MLHCCRCDKDVQSDQFGNLYCECIDERLSESANVGWWHEQETWREPDKTERELAVEAFEERLGNREGGMN